MVNSICGVWASPDGSVHLALADGDSADSQRYVVSESFSPFIWLLSEADLSESQSSENIQLSGPNFARLRKLARFPTPGGLDAFFKSRDKNLPVQKISSIENQYLLSGRLRMFANMTFPSLRRIQLDIETYSEKGFPKASRQGDRIIAVGISGYGGRKIIELEDFSDAAERKLLESLNKEIKKRDPDIIEGHNIFNFDLPYLAERCKRVGADSDWGRFGAPVKFRSSRLKIAERIYTYMRCDIPGRTIVDTMLLVQMFDISAREMPSYSLKESAVHFGLSDPNERTYIPGREIQNIFLSDKKRFSAYLSDDLRETAGLSELLLPTYFAQVKNFPMTFQECLLRGSGMKVESLFLEKYFEAKAALPLPQGSGYFEGALSESYKLGVFKNVLHYDVASLYPSLMLVMGKCPSNDYLGVFLQELKALREYRLKYKAKAREAESELLRAEFDARQKSFKILINSFYGYLGLDMAVFGDVELAREVTARGRELLRGLIEAFKSLNCEILEADTDGIYLTSGEYFDRPGELLKKVMHAMPDGIELEHDGSFEAMLCYKTKNYALMKGGDIILRGSSFRNRSAEKFLRTMTETLISSLLRGDVNRIEALISDIVSKIKSGKADIYDLAKGEYLGKNPEAYEREIAETGKGRRAAMEVALKMSPRPQAGEKVLYYISAADGKKTSDWKRAMPVSEYDPQKTPYDVDYYLKKIDDWRERYSDLLQGVKIPADTPVQGELFGSGEF